MHRLVSPFILEKYAAGESAGQFEAATLFVDMSGFSAMTSALMEHGQHGAEVLAQVMRAIFDPLVATVYANGGFVTNFAGDAFTAVFPTLDSIPPLQTSSVGIGAGGESLRALAVAHEIQQHVLANPHHVTPYGDFTVAVKIGLAAGEVRWGIIRSEDESRTAFYFRGDAIDGCANAEKHAKHNGLILHPSVRTIFADVVATQPVVDGYVQVVDVLASDLRSPPPESALWRLPEPDPDVQARFFPGSIVEQTHTGEFRQVINVFIGLDGEPSLRQLTGFVRTVFALQEKFGGLLNRIDFGDKGCSLLLFWGAPVSYENDILRTLSFLLELHDATSIPIRGGVTYRVSHAGFIGSELHEEYTCYGLGVNLAARMMTSAPFETIWLDEPMKVRSEHEFELAYEDHYRFKGFEEEQAVYTLLGYQPEDEVDYYKRRMVGRQKELDYLHLFAKRTLRKEVANRFAGIVVIQGEAGIGKSRLIYEFKRQLEDVQETQSVARPRWCHCQTESILHQSLNPFRYWLRHYFDYSATQSDAHNKRMFSHRLTQLFNATSDETLLAELEHGRSFLGALVGLFWPDSLYASLDPQSRFESTINALKALILAESLRQPVILHLEDAHWLDDDSLLFMRRLVQGIEHYPVAIIATARPLDSDAFFQALSFHQLLILDGLSREELAILAVDILDGQPSPVLLELLMGRGSGNPFFTEQILLFLRDENLLEASSEGWMPSEKALLASPLPTNVRAVFIARLDRLTQGVRSVVQTAAVLGREFEINVLSNMLRSDAVQRRVKHAEEAEIWSAITEIRYLFKHILLQEAAYEMQVQTRRAELHLLAAESLVTLHKDVLTLRYSEIAYHYEMACKLGLGEVCALACEYLTLAGKQSKEKYENASAVDYFTRALALMPEDAPSLGSGQVLEARYELVRLRELVNDARGKRDMQKADVELMQSLAEALDDDHRRAEALVRLCVYYEETSQFAEEAEVSQKAIAFARKAGDAEREAQGYYEWGTALYRLGEMAEAQERMAEGLALAQAAGLPEQEAHLHFVLGFVLNAVSEFDKAEEQFQQALALYKRVGERSGEMSVYNSLAINASYVGDLDSAQAYFEKAIGMAREMGRRMAICRHMSNLGQLSIYRGDYATALAYCEQALPIAYDIGHHDGVGILRGHMGVIASKWGQFEQARAYFGEALSISEDVGNAMLEAEMRNNFGLLYSLMGEYETALPYTQQAVEMSRSSGIRMLEGMALTAHGHVLLGLEEVAEAEKCYRAAVALREEIGQANQAIESRAGVARAALAQKDLTAALTEVQAITNHFARTNGVVTGVNNMAWKTRCGCI